MFRQLVDALYVAPQITADDVAAAHALGVGLIINNRPEGESDDQTPGDAIAAAAAAHGIGYVAIPVTHAGFSMNQIAAMAEALANAGDAPVLAYCRSGTRSTLLWALTMARAGMAPAAIAEAASAAGYSVAPIAGEIAMLAGGAGARA